MSELRQLTTIERRELKTLEATVTNGLKAAFDVGRALRQIRDSQLYQYLDMTWEGYLKKRWPQEISRTYSHYLIEGSTAADQLKGLVIEGSFTIVNEENAQTPKKPPKCEVGKDLELNECQTRELIKIEDETERADILAAAVTFTKDGKPILSAAAIRKERLKRESANEPEPEPEPDETEEEYDPTAEMERASKAIESFCRQLGAMWKELPEDPWLEKHGLANSAHQALKDCQATLRLAKCKHLCPDCEGDDDCKLCLGTGRIPKSEYNQLGLSEAADD